jgi:hypothetical protein
MSKLSSSQRKALPAKDFAVPGRKYPVNDPNHARAALSRVAANGTPAQKAEVKAAVKRRYPGIHVD